MTTLEPPSRTAVVSTPRSRQREPYSGIGVEDGVVRDYLAQAQGTASSMVFIVDLPAREGAQKEVAREGDRRGSAATKCVATWCALRHGFGCQGPGGVGSGAPSRRRSARSRPPEPRAAPSCEWSKPWGVSKKSAYALYVARRQDGSGRHARVVRIRRSQNARRRSASSSRSRRPLSRCARVVQGDVLLGVDLTPLDAGAVVVVHAARRPSSTLR